MPRARRSFRVVIGPSRTLCSVGIAALVVWAGSSDARTWRVRPDGSGDAPTVPAALDSAQRGDVVLLEAGTYTWTTQGSDGHPSDPSMLRVTRPITLRGVAGAAQTILDAEGRGRVLRCTDAGDVRIEDLTLTGGAASGAGGGLLCDGDTRPHVVGCIVRDNRSGARAPGGGVSLANGTLRDCTLRDNATGLSGFGGGAHGVATRVEGCTFIGNVTTGGDAGGGAGGGLWGDGVTVVACVFDSNRADGAFTATGGGVYERGAGSVRGSTFVGNTARGTMNQGFGGGVYAFAGADLENCVFVGNTATSVSAGGLGGAVYGRGATRLAGCTLLANSSGVHFDGAATVERTIVAWSAGAPCTGSATWSCSNLFGNAGGDVACGTNAGGNFSADPEFCAVDPLASRAFVLQSDSPCAAGNHPQGAVCGNVGAFGVGCDDVRADDVTWGRVKSLYR